MSAVSPTVVDGPRWYRSRIRSLGPLAALVPPALLGALAWWVLRSSEGRTSGLFGLVAGVIAAPGLLVAGAPFSDDATYRIAVLASAGMWLLLGLVASRRATRSPVATWRDFWREYSLVALGVALGAISALIASTAVLGEALL
ncbi:MAG: hypothetical protein MUE78_11055 [Ilumatobacteraceae bacterium]|nr:hypothetical protein [Ilumatobacteraceae bacterium]